MSTLVRDKLSIDNSSQNRTELNYKFDWCKLELSRSQVAPAYTSSASAKDSEIDLSSTPSNFLLLQLIIIELSLKLKRNFSVLRMQ